VHKAKENTCVKKKIEKQAKGWKFSPRGSYEEEEGGVEHPI